MIPAAAPDTRSSAKPLVADSLSKSIVLLGCLMILQRGIGFVRSFYVCGSLSPTEVGQWDLAFNFLAIVAPLAVFGIPGSFGRYIARYESIGRERRFLTHTLGACLGLSLLASTSIFVFRSSVALYFFGSPAHADFVAMLAIGLPFVVFFNYATSWFTGKRLNRVVFRIQFAQTLFFAALCVAAFEVLSVTAVAVVIAYFLSCLVGMCLAASYALLDRSAVGEREYTGEELSIWRRILPFAVWVWISNALFNFFSVCDRILLVNFYSEKSADSQFLIGQYHTACIFPLLLMTVGAMLGSMLIPYLSKDWEAGNHDAVTRRMNLMIKAVGLLCFFAAVVILLVAPLLFSGIWKDKFAIGESLLPATLCYSGLAAMSFVAQKYFWCIEKTWFSSSVLLVGLVANFVLGLAFIGPFGIEGVVASTLAAHAIVLIGVLALCNRHGFRVDTGVVLIGVAMLAICLGKLAACFCLAGLFYFAVCSQLILADADKQNAIDSIRSFRASLFGTVS